MSYLSRSVFISTRAFRALQTASTPSLASASRRYASKSESDAENASKSNQNSTGRTPPGPKQGAYPKILDESPPPNPPEDVKKHNEAFENRHDRASNKINPDGKENVGKGYWSGDVGIEDKQK